MRTCLITGAAGSIGCHVVAHLLDNTDWKLILLDSFRHMGEAPRITETMKGRAQGQRNRMHVVVHDLTAPITTHTSKLIGDVDYIINLASLSDVWNSLEDPVPFVETNVKSILNILEYARSVGVQAFLQVSTDEVYGPTDGTFLHKEWDPIVPSSPYSASKAAQEAIAISYWRAYKVPLIIVNLMNNFGEMQSSRKFPVIVQRKIDAGETVTIHGSPNEDGSRFYIHSRNTADALLHILHLRPPYPHMNGCMDKPDRYNIPGDAQVTNTDLAQMIAGALGRNPDLHYEDFHTSRPGHDRHYGLDGTKLRETGWRSPRSFSDSLLDTVRWQKDHPEWLV